VLLKVALLAGGEIFKQRGGTLGRDIAPVDRVPDERGGTESRKSSSVSGASSLPYPRGGGREGVNPAYRGPNHISSCYCNVILNI